MKKMFVHLHHQNPPSLSTMLKCAGRFIFSIPLKISHYAKRLRSTILFLQPLLELWQTWCMRRTENPENVVRIHEVPRRIGA